MERPLWRRGLQEETTVDILLIGFTHLVDRGGQSMISALGGIIKQQHDF